MQHTLVPPGAAPPPESEADIVKCDLLSRIGRGSQFFTDGAPAWDSVVRRTRKDLKHMKVIHKKNELVRKVQLGSRVHMAGTQVIDRLWQTLDGYIPSGMTAKKGKKVNPVVWQYVYSFLWRHNLLGKPLRPALAALCRRTS